ncbi:MAG: hypothetical protein HYZ57_12695, partial [Acidobacteria bacterium]|nr:hypothetical protein [Acidobacteriota bacterium]
DRRQRPAPLEIAQAMPLVERALQVLERRAVQPQLGLLKSTMLQLDSAFSERAYGANSFSEFVDRLKKADYVHVTGTGGRVLIERKGTAKPEVAAPKPEEALPLLRDVLEIHRLEIEEGSPAEQLETWMKTEYPAFDHKRHGFQEFAEFLNFAQDRLVVRNEPDEEKGLAVYLGAEFYPPAAPLDAEAPPVEEEVEEKQPIVAGQPSMVAPTPPVAPEKPVRKRAPRKRAAGQNLHGMGGDRPRPRRTSRKKTHTD